MLPEGIYDLDFVLPPLGGWLSLETHGGTSQGEGSPWWFYYDASVGGKQTNNAGQYIVAVLMLNM